MVFLWSKRNWWALIPAGILSGIGAGLLWLGSGPESASRANLMNGVMFLVWAAAFGVLWLLRGSRPTTWAKYPAIGMAIIAVIVLSLGVTSGIILPLLVIGAGVVVVAINLLPKRTQ